jgi:hypothetical protein
MGEKKKIWIRKVTKERTSLPKKSQNGEKNKIEENK